MSQIVYYGCRDNMLSFDLEPLIDHIHTNIIDTRSSRGTAVLSCPAFKDFVKNTFVVKSIYTYEITWDGEKFTSSMYDQKFFNEVILERSVTDGMLSYISPKPIFVSESDDLNISLEHAAFHNNDITNSTFIIPGIFNIGKHLPRGLELALKFKQPGTIKINEGDALYYVKFHTDEKIVFKKFIFTKEINDLTNSILSMRPFTHSFKNLKWWYNLVSRHNLKKYCLKIIKQNLL